MPAPGHDHGQRQLLVVVVEDLETVVAAVADLVELARQLRHLIAVHSFPGKHAKVSRRVDALLGRAQFLPHEVGELHEEDLFRIDLDAIEP